MFDKTHVLFYNSTLLKGGTDVYMMEIIRNISKDNFQVDVVIKDGETFDQTFYSELLDRGCNVFIAKGSQFAKLKSIRTFLKKNRKQYDVAHINATSQATGLIVFLCKKVGKIKKIIFHSHMGGNDHKKNAIDKVGFWLLKKNVDIYAACSNTAADFMFGKKLMKTNKVEILTNAVNVDKFDYDVQIREKMRKEYGLGEKDFAILHVGRFAEQKNHKYLIEIFKQLLNMKSNKHYKLYLIGDGELKEKIIEDVRKYELNDEVEFLGLKNNVSDYMQMADVLVMPSIHEGLPFVAVEAQASGLPCILSNKISTETAIIKELVQFVGIDADDIPNWIRILNKYEKHIIRISTKQTMIERGINTQSSIKKVEDLYGYKNSDL